MTAPVWIASPPEVHSALLSAGPGPGPLLAAAGAWTSLSTEYASAAAELGGLMAAVQAGSWQGPSAMQYAAAHLPYLAWLEQASADTAGLAAQHEVAATAYTAALTTMPTLMELAANHMVHGVLLATNFFGINTIPIAVNEADYARMWVQAATTMGAYQAATGTALASAPRTSAAPSIVRPGGEGNSPAQSDPTSWLSQLLQGYLNFYQDMLNQLSSFLQNPMGSFQQMLSAFGANPLAALIAYGPLLLFAAYEVISPIVTYGPLLALPLILGLSLGPQTLPVADTAPVAAPAAAGVAARPPVLAATGQPTLPAVGMAPTVSPAPAPAPASAPATGAGAPSAPAPAATVSHAYIVGGGGDPGTGFGPTLGGRGGAKAPAATIPAAAAGVPVRADARARRRRRAALREYGDEFADMNVGVAPDWAVPSDTGSEASDRGAGPLGFAGTTHKETAAGATGLTKLAGDDFGGGPRMPMVPGTWEQDADGADRPDARGRGGQDS